MQLKNHLIFIVIIINIFVQNQILEILNSSTEQTFIVTDYLVSADFSCREQDTFKMLAIQNFRED
jgi:hypothetical protein